MRPSKLDTGAESDPESPDSGSLNYELIYDDFTLVFSRNSRLTSGEAYQITSVRPSKFDTGAESDPESPDFRSLNYELIYDDLALVFSRNYDFACGEPHEITVVRPLKFWSDFVSQPELTIIGSR